MAASAELWNIQKTLYLDVFVDDDPETKIDGTSNLIERGY